MRKESERLAAWLRHKSKGCRFRAYANDTLKPYYEPFSPMNNKPFLGGVDPNI